MANTNKNPLCINELQVHSIIKEAPNVTTLNFIAQDFYQYKAGQYAMVSIRNTPHIARADSLTSTLSESRFQPHRTVRAVLCRSLYVKLKMEKALLG